MAKEIPKEFFFNSQPSNLNGTNYRKYFKNWMDEKCNRGYPGLPHNAFQTLIICRVMAEAMGIIRSEVGPIPVILMASNFTQHKNRNYVIFIFLPWYPVGTCQGFFGQIFSVCWNSFSKKQFLSNVPFFQKDPQNFWKNPKLFPSFYKLFKHVAKT